MGGLQRLASRRAEGLVLQRDDHRGQAVVDAGDVAYLASEQGSAALELVAGRPLTDSSLVADIAWARKEFGGHAPALISTVQLRRKATAKLADAGRWLFTDEAMQQSTAAPVAAHRARRLSGRAVHDATCSIGAELDQLRHTASVVVGSDLDPVRLAMARHNVPDVTVCRADALRPITGGDVVVVLDPARRSGGRRRFDPRDYTPALDAVLEVYRGRDIVVKVAPGIDFDRVAEMGFRGEIEVTSWRGSVREACLWSGGLTGDGVTRRATVLDTGEQVTDIEPDDCAAGPAGRWIVDPDGAVVRAGLVRHYAARHGLWQLDPDIAYLTGDALPPGVRGFEVLDQIAFSDKRLRQALVAMDCGPLEILIRGVDVDPDALRRRLKLGGSQALTVVLTRIGHGSAGRAVAFVCRPTS